MNVDGSGPKLLLKDDAQFVDFVVRRWHPDSARKLRRPRAKDGDVVVRGLGSRLRNMTRERASHCSADDHTNA
jgi:hypothetical protein